jgi:DNA polymerase-3 subunit alpha
VRAVDLHHHNTFSFGDGFGTPEQHAARLEVLERSHFAVTDHGNVSAHPQVEKAALKHGLKPIFGLEAYTALDDHEMRKFHLTILASNAEGYRNLMQIVTKSYQHFYHWPTVTGEMLAEHHEGLIVLSGCADSLLACSLLGGKSIDAADASWKRAKRVANSFKDLFGDRYYLETQAFPELERARTLNAAYERMGKELGIPLVGTQDVHYPLPEDNEMQVILHAAMRGSGSVAQQEAGWEYNIRLTPASSDKAFGKRLWTAGLSKRAVVGALESTWEIAGRCDVTLPKADRFRYPLEPGMTAQETIWQWLRDGWKYRVAHGETWLQENAEEAHERVKYEMGSITAKDFVDYFLMTSDIVRYAKDNFIPVGPARGSAAASLVCYLLRITEINPLRYPLMFFDRFIALDRTDIPDIDLDFDDGRRHLVREYAVRKYGEARVGNIANYVRYKGKNSLDDVGRVFPQIPMADIETFKATIIERSGGDSRADAALIDTAEMFPIAGAIFDKWPDLRKAARLEGNYRGMSIHAAGIVIANSPIDDTCALYTRTHKRPGKPDETVTVVSVDKKDGEYLGLMKMDFLSLSTMGMIRDTLEAVGMPLEDLYAIKMDEARTLEAFRENDVIGIFQYEGRAQRLINRKIKPDDFLELSDINGLSRPGPLFSGTTTDYINIKWGAKKLEKVHPLWDDFTTFTKGQIIYQEQVLQALAVIGGLPVHRVHEIRKIISQKLGEAQFNASSQDFIDGARTLHSIKPEVAKYMWGRLVTSATYSFNIAHCISYAMLAFWCMWLKVHYPVQFYAAQLRATKKEGWQRLIKDAARHEIEVNGVDAAKSGMEWTARPKKRIVNAGWLQLPQIGEVTARKIIAYREDIARTSPGHKMAMPDIINVNGIGPATMEKILSVDSLDPFGLRKVEAQMQGVLASVRNEELGAVPRPTHISNDLLEAAYDRPLVFYGMVKARNYQDYVENQRSRSGQEIEEILRNMKRKDLVTSCVLQAYDQYDEDVYLRFNRYSYPRFKVALERIIVDHSVVVVRGQKKSNVNVFGINIAVENMWIIDPD